MKLSIIETRTVPTILAVFNGKRIFFHSKYDPLNEADIWCHKTGDNIKTDKEIIVVGLGAGYHIQRLAQLHPTQNIVVIEFNHSLYKWFKDSPFYLPTTHYKNINIKQFNLLSDSEKERIFSSANITNLLIHKNGLDIIPFEYEKIKQALEDLVMQQNSLRQQLGNLLANFKKNNTLNDASIGVLKNRYKGKPMILVSAGPSLDKQLPLLKKIRDERNYIIGAVGTAIKPLIKANIIPDFFAITDPKQTTYKQLTDINLPETPLFYISTACHETIRLHTGPRRIIYQDGYEDAEKQAMLKNEPTIQTGGSVATTLLDIMVYLGGEAVALIGQDLAYTDGRSHAEGTHAHKEKKGLKKVESYYRNSEVQTSNNLTLYRKWFERYAKKNQKLKLYNCTEGGAYIQNWQHISLFEFYTKYRK